MHWHLDPTALLARSYPVDAGADGQACYDAAVPYFAIATIQLLGGGKANIIGHLRRDDSRIRQRDYRALLNQLRNDFGVTEVSWTHGGEESAHDTQPAPL